MYNKHVYRQSQVRMPNGCGVEWAECSLIIGTGCRVKVFLAWSSIAQSVCQRAFSLLAIWCLRPWWIRILPSAEDDNLSPLDSNIACLCQSIEIDYNKHVYRQSQVRMPNGCGVEWAECSLIIGTGCRVKVFLAWSSIAQSVCQRAFSLLAIWCLRPWWVRILPSAEDDNLSPLDSNIACLCQSIEIDNNKHVYRQSQVRMPNGCGVEWAECSLIIGTGCRVQVFSLILDSSVGLSVGIQSAGDLVSETLMGSNPAFSRGRQLVSFRFEYRFPVPEHRNWQQQICMYVCMYVCIKCLQGDIVCFLYHSRL